MDQILPEPTGLRSGHLQFGGGGVSALKQRDSFALIRKYPFLFWLSF